MTDRVMDIEERISRSLQDSLNELYLLMQEEAGHLDDVKERFAAISQELRELAAAIDQAGRGYERSRADLLDSSKLGETGSEKLSYERASEFMKMRGSLEERYRLLSEQKNELAHEERRLERLMAKSENMGNRLRMVLNLLATPEDFTQELTADDVHKSGAMMTAFLMAEREATNFARDLHDGPAQTFAAVGLMLEMGQEYMKRQDYPLTQNALDRSLEQTRNGLNEIRAFLFKLRPTGIEDGFDIPMKRLASQVHQIWGCKLTYTLDGHVGEVPADIRVCAFKTLHQAVLNASRHGASEIKVGLNCVKNVLRVRVTDNGKGFDVEREKIAAKERGSYGLSNMEDRVKMLGGKISISSVLKKGTNISFSIPVLQ